MTLIIPTPLYNKKNKTLNRGNSKTTNNLYYEKKPTTIVLFTIDSQRMDV